MEKTHKITFKANLLSENEYHTELEHELKGGFTIEQLAQLALTISKIFNKMIIKAMKDSIDESIDLNTNLN